MILSKSDYCKYSSVWLEFYDLEREFGDEKHQRKLLMRALNEVSSINDTEIIYDLLIKFEKLNGNIQQYSSIYLKYSAQSKFLSCCYIKEGVLTFENSFSNSFSRCFR